jgi:hypothetical protein
MVRCLSSIALPLAGVALVLATAVAQSAVNFKDREAEDLFRASRLAVSGTPGAIAKLKTLAFKGTSSLPATDGSTINATVEIKILLPDYYIRVDTMGSGERVQGYAGSKLLDMTRGGGRTSAPPDQAKAQLLKVERSELARLLLGTTTWVSTEQSMTFYSRGTPVAMPGPASPLGLDVVGDNGQPLLRFFVEAEPRVPTRIVYWSGENAVWTTAFADRRDVSGWRLPHHITTTSAKGSIDEMIFDEIVVNPPLTKADFAR